MSLCSDIKQLLKDENENVIIKDDFPPVTRQQSRSRTSLNSTDDEDIKLLRQKPHLLLKKVGERLNNLTLTVPKNGSSYKNDNARASSPVPSIVRTPDSPSRSESPSVSLSPASPSSWKSSRGNDSQSSPRSPNKEILPKMNKSRNDKFHKLFKAVPEEEMCLKGYSCAYMGDILLQGYLYISPNWFCFHSKILGIEKQIRIQVHQVLNITREKTAIFIPNAVGIVTKEDKYVFGSLMSRDNTYRIMYTVWKSLTEPGIGDGKLPAVLQQIPDDVYGDNNNLARDGTSIDDSESDVSICMQCGLAVHEHSNDAPCGSTEGFPESVVDVAQVNTSSTEYPPIARSTSKTSTLTSTPTSDTKNSSTLSATTPPPQELGSKSLNKYPGHQQASVISATFQNGKVPHTNYMLLVCVVMVIFLSISAVIMLHKILVIQAVLDASPGSSHVINSDEDVYNSLYYLNHEYHVASIKRFHSILEANINVLNQIHMSLKTLQVSISEHKTSSCFNATTTIPTSSPEDGNS